MKLLIAAASLALSLPHSSAFHAPSVSKSGSALCAQLNGWTPSESQFAYGLPGKVAPFTEGFDPFNIASRASLDDIKSFRESEVTHGRVAMLAVIGFLFTEAPLSFHPLFSTGDRDIGPAIRHLDEVRAASPIFFEILAVTIGAFELLRALKGWEVFSGKNLKDDYYPGDIGFDPLGFKPKDTASFNEMATKELNNGRLAMIGVAGFIAQELVNGKEIFVTLGVSPDTFDPTSLPVQF